LGLKIGILKDTLLEKEFKHVFYISHFSFLLVSAGTVKIQVNATPLYLTSNSLITIPVKSFCKVLDISSHGVIYIITFTPDFALKNSIKKPHMRLLELLTMQFSKAVLLKQEEVFLLTDLIRLLCLGIKKPNNVVFKEEIIQFKFNALLYEIIGMYSTYVALQSSDKTSKETLVLRFFNILLTHCKAQHEVGFYAEYLGISSGHLNKILKEVTGKTAKESINETLIAQAKFLLQNKYLTLSSICAVLHFRNLSAFCRFFKKHTSFSPLEYRKKKNFM